MNPLRAHYHCPKCGHLEMIDNHLFGIDLPKKACPNCKEEMTGDGYNLAIESVWGVDGKNPIEFFYNISSDFLPLAKKVLQKIYPDNQIVKYADRSNKQGNSSNPEAKTMKQFGYVILPQNTSYSDYPDLVDYLKDGEPCIKGLGQVIEQHGLKRIILYPHYCIDYMMQLQKKSGICAAEIGINELRELKYDNLINTKVMEDKEEQLFYNEMPKTFYEMTGYCALLHNSSFVFGVSCEKIIATPDFKKFSCCTGEDFFDYLVEFGLERKDAFYFSELIRKGKAKKSPEWDALSIPEELKNVAKMYKYVFPRAHCIEYLLMYARLAYYMK